MSAFYRFAFGLLPLWIDIGLIFYSQKTGNSSLTTLFAWALLLAIPACGVSIALTEISISVYQRTHGGKARKTANASAFVATAFILLGFAVIAYLDHQKNKEAALRAEAKVVEAFARNDPGVVALIGPPKGSSIVVYSGSPPMRYEVSVEGQGTIYAIIDVQRNGNRRKLQIVCTTAIYFGHRESGKDPCSQ